MDWEKHSIRRGGIGFLININIKTAITIEQQENTKTETMWIKIRLKRKEALFIGLFYGKQKSRNNNITKNLTLQKEIYTNIEQLIEITFSYLVTLMQKLEMRDHGIPNGDPKLTPNGRRLINLTNKLNLKFINKSPKMQRQMDKNKYQK